VTDRESIDPTQRRIARCVGLAAFLFQFEAGFVQVSLPEMQRELGCSAADTAWVMTLYLLGAVLTLLPAGALGRRLGFARTFVAGGARYLAPFYLESVLRLTSAESGLWMLLLALGVALASFVAGRSSDRYGSGAFLLSAYLTAAAGCLLFAIRPQGSHATVLFLLLALGLAAGLFSSPNNRLMMTGVPREFEREVGALLAVALNAGSMAGVFVFDRAVHALAPSQVSGERASTAVDLFAAYPRVYLFAGASFLLMACPAFRAKQPGVGVSPAIRRQHLVTQRPRPNRGGAPCSGQPGTVCRSSSRQRRAGFRSADCRAPCGAGANSLRQVAAPGAPLRVAFGGHPGPVDGCVHDATFRLTAVMARGQAGR
jgi:MFS family permease